MANVAINGLGRIGRATLKILDEHPELNLVAVNDLAPPDSLLYLLRYDTVYGRYEKELAGENGHLRIGGHTVQLCHEKDPARLPWGDLGVDIVFECTGALTTSADLRKHLEAGARHVILSAPAKDEDTYTVVHGASRRGEPTQMVSCASCTTNCITPVAEVMDRRIGVQKAIMTTVHAYTSTQKLVDAPSKKPRRGRAAAANMVPASTGAAKATARVLPQFKGKFDGVAIRVPVPVVSLADVVFLTRRPTTVEEVNRVFQEEARSERYQGILGVTEDPIVSSDIVKDPRASIVDLELTQVVDGDLVKVMSWYDNEWGYASQMVREASEMARALSPRDEAETVGAH